MFAEITESEKLITHLSRPPERLRRLLFLKQVYKVHFRLTQYNFLKKFLLQRYIISTYFSRLLLRLRRRRLLQKKYSNPELVSFHAENIAFMPQIHSLH